VHLGSPERCDSLAKRAKTAKEIRSILDEAEGPDGKIIPRTHPRKRRFLLVFAGLAILA
jgi:hypothetical protein